MIMLLLLFFVYRFLKIAEKSAALNESKTLYESMQSQLELMEQQKEDGSTELQQLRIVLAEISSSQYVFFCVLLCPFDACCVL